MIRYIGSKEYETESLDLNLPDPEIEQVFSTVQKKGELIIAY